MSRQVLVDMNAAEANALRRLMMHLQSARQLDQFISSSPWAYRQELIDLTDREVLAAQANFDTWLEQHGVPKEQAFDVDFDRGSVYAKEEVINAPDSESVNEPGAGAANDGVQRDGE